jgi:hypothetical protein
MDAKIKKIQKEVEHKELPKAKKDLKGLLKADKKMDKKMDKMKKACK